MHELIEHAISTARRIEAIADDLLYAIRDAKKNAPCLHEISEDAAKRIKAIRDRLSQEITKTYEENSNADSSA